VTRIRVFLAAALAFGFSGGLRAETPAEAGTQPRPAAKSDDSSLGTIRNLLEASRHLEEAGAGELAQQVRGKASELLSAEFGRLEQERKELVDLSREMEPEQVQISATIVTIYDFDSDQLERAVEQCGGRRTDSAIAPGNGVSFAGFLGDSKDANEFIRAIDGTVVSRPKVMALDGQLAEITIGNVMLQTTGVRMEDGQATPVVADADVGLSISIIPTIISDHETRLKLAMWERSVSGDETTIFEDPKTATTITAPVFQTTRSQAVVDATNGSAYLLAIPSQPAMKNSDKNPATLLMLTSSKMEGH